MLRFCNWSSFTFLIYFGNFSTFYHSRRTPDGRKNWSLCIYFNVHSRDPLLPACYNQEVHPCLWLSWWESSQWRALSRVATPCLKKQRCAGGKKNWWEHHHRPQEDPFRAARSRHEHCAASSNPPHIRNNPISNI